MLRHDLRVREVLKGDRVGAMNSLKIGSSKRRFVSADLTAATDRIPFNLARALWSGLQPFMTEHES
jgi:hypothetical protein